MAICIFCIYDVYVKTNVEGLERRRSSLLISENELGIILPIVVKPTENLFHTAPLKFKHRFK